MPWRAAGQLLAGLLGALATALWQPAALAEAQFVGSQACAGCHPTEYARWQDSQHAHSMQHASEDSVLGDFADARFEYNGVRSRFYRRAGGFYVQTDGADGRLAEFRIGYAFGVFPLQQYLVEFPDGRLQALSIAWDSRPADQGGQRWFHLYPEQQVGHADPLHWTRPAHNWNFMCADCHSTNLRKNYDAARDRFATRWSEISVGCEACHGPGSAHLHWASSGRQDGHKGLSIRLDERRGSGWRTTLEDIAGRDTARKEHEVCAQCHSRRQQIAEGYHAGKPLLDHYRPALLEPGLYHADGQQREEVFVSASFAQSRMFHAGVTCSDCHEPHGQRLRLEGNALCGQCHLPARFDSREHHFHPADSPGAQCVSCHMPQTTYMVVDPRRDHSLRIPRPDLGATLGTPDACSQCHAAEGPQWAAEQIRRHRPGPAKGFQDFAATFAAAELGQPTALQELARRIGDPGQPAVVRASAAARLAPRADARHWPALLKGLRDPDPTVRLASIGGLAGAAPAQRSEWLTPLLDDPLRAVRIEAARLLADLPPSAEHPDALAEYEASLRRDADRAESRAAMAALRQRQGRLTEARAELEQALRLDPLSVQGHLNLADLFRALGQEEQSIHLLRQGIERRPRAALLHYALALGLTRQKQPEAARASLLRAHQLDPDQPLIAYAHALSLWPHRADAAREVLEKAIRLHPYEARLRHAAASFARQSGNHAAALRHADCLKTLQQATESSVRLPGERSEPAVQTDSVDLCADNAQRDRWQTETVDSAR